jgi:hypothetical protein
VERSKAKLILKELEEAVKKVAEKHGMDVRVSGGRFDSNGLKPRLEFMTRDTEGRTREEREWDIYAESLGLDKSILGKQYNGKKIVGLDMKKRKYPVILETRDGVRYKTSVMNVKSGWYTNVGE